MSKTKHGVWAKLLAKYAKDASPEELAEAVEAIDEIVSEEPEAEEKPVKDADVNEKLDAIMDKIDNLPIPAEKTEEDEDEVVEATEEEVKPVTDGDKLDTLIAKLDLLLEKMGTDCGSKNCAKDEEPEKEADPLEKLEDELDKLDEEEGKAIEGDEDEVEAEGEIIAPDEDPSEPESHFVDPEEINEKDEDEVEPEDKEELPVGDKAARDAMRAAIRVVKPLVAKLPDAERKAACDAAVASIRESYGMSKKPTKNSYTQIAQAKRNKAIDRASRDENAELAKRIMEKRNCNYKK